MWFWGGSGSPSLPARGLGSAVSSQAGSEAEPRPPNGFLSLCAARLPLSLLVLTYWLFTGGTNTWLVPLTVSWGTCPLCLNPGFDAYAGTGATWRINAKILQAWTSHCAVAQAPPLRRTQAPPSKFFDVCVTEKNSIIAVAPCLRPWS